MERIVQLGVSAECKSLTRVLVVDDERPIRELITEMLEDEGYAVDSAATGAAALAHMRHSRPDAIVLDLMMPVMDGWHVVAAMRRERVLAAVPIVIVSASYGLAETCADLGVQEYVTKPFEMDVLLEAVGRLTHADAA